METVLGTRRKELPQLSDSACDKCLMYQLFNISKQELIRLFILLPFLSSKSHQSMPKSQYLQIRNAKLPPANLLGLFKPHFLLLQSIITALGGTNRQEHKEPTI